jgi:hypothetical protein
MKKIIYPTADTVIDMNTFALTFVRAKKSDKHEIMSHSKIVAIIEECENSTGDLYDKAKSRSKELYSSTLSQAAIGGLRS